MFVESDGALLIGLAACGVQYSGIAAGAVIGKAISVHRCLDKESFHRLAGRRRTARDYFRNWRRAMHMRMLFLVSYLRLLLPTNSVKGLPHVSLGARRVLKRGIQDRFHDAPSSCASTGLTET
jgi:hypothetical protein